MSSPASIAKHPIHPMLIVFPIGLWTFSLVCDVIYVLGGNNPIWNTVALYTCVGGIIGALLAAIPGLVDYLSIDEKEMKRIGTIHMLVNLGAVAVFLAGSLLRVHGSNPITPLVLSLIGIVLIGFGGWYGGEMVYVKGMAVEAVEDLAEAEERRKSERRRSPIKMRKAG